MTAVPEGALADAARAYKLLDLAVFEYYDDLDGFRREVELAQTYLRGIALRMGWSK